MQWNGCIHFLMNACFAQEADFVLGKEKIDSDHIAESPSPPLCCTIELCLRRGKRIESMLEASPREVDWRNANSKRYRIATAAEVVGFTWQCILLIESDCRFFNPFGFSGVYKQKRRDFNFSLWHV